MSNGDATDVNHPTLSVVEGGPAAGDEPREYRVLVVAAGRARTYPFAAGTVLIGRSEEAEVRIDSPRLSRRHARLVLGDTPTIEDCGSSNGTYVRGGRLPGGESVEIEFGETVDLGDVATLVVQKPGKPRRLHRLWPHGYFEARVEEECARAARGRGVFTVLRIAVPADARSRLRVESSLAECFRASDIVARYGPGEFEVLLIDADESTAGLVAARLSGAVGRRGLQARVGSATFPRDGRGAQGLIAAAGADLGGIESAEARRTPLLTPAEGAMEKLNRLVARIAVSPISIILQGETGVGKEVVARRIHELSDRCDAAFVTVNCGALAESLLESELFGHERGAFTGATSAKTGLLEAASGGTIFLDEIGEMPVSLQVKLLRVLEAREVLPVGGVRPKAIDVRVLAATHRDLEEDVRHGLFRQDLFFRLNGITLTIPPLRERVDEIESLAMLFLARACEQMKRGTVGAIVPEALDALKAYWWPGNIRELRNAIERAVVLSADGVVDCEHLPLEKMVSPLGLDGGEGPGRFPEVTRVPRAGVHPAGASAAPGGGRVPASVSVFAPFGGGAGRGESGSGACVGGASVEAASGEAASGESTGQAGVPYVCVANAPGSVAAASGAAPASPAGASGYLAQNQNGDLKQQVQRLERDRMIEALQMFGGNQTRAAKHLGVSRGTLSARMEAYGIPRPRKRSS